MSNPFYQKPLPNITVWTAELQQQWDEVRQGGRWRYALRMVRTRFTGAPLITLIVGVSLIIVTPPLMDGDFRNLFWFFRAAPWLIVAFFTAAALAGFAEGWLRWGLYEQHTALVRGWRPFLHTLRTAPGASPVALVYPPLRGAGPQRLLVLADATWREVWSHADTSPTDVLSLPDGRLLAMGLGGDLLIRQTDGGWSTYATGLEGAYLIPVDGQILLAGTPTSQWYDPTQGTLTPLAVQTMLRPALHNGRAYLFDPTTRRIAIVDRAGVTEIATPAQAGDELAVADDGTIALAERVGPYRDQGRVWLCATGRWERLPTPFTCPAFGLVWEGDQLLALALREVYHYDRATGQWSEATDPGARWDHADNARSGWRFAGSPGPTLLFETGTGQILTRRDGGWHADLPPVPLA